MVRSNSLTEAFRVSVALVFVLLAVSIGAQSRETAVESRPEVQAESAVSEPPIFMLHVELRLVLATGKDSLSTKFMDFLGQLRQGKWAITMDSDGVVYYRNYQMPSSFSYDPSMRGYEPTDYDALKLLLQRNQLAFGGYFEHSSEYSVSTDPEVDELLRFQRIVASDLLDEAGDRLIQGYIQSELAALTRAQYADFLENTSNTALELLLAFENEQQQEISALYATSGGSILESVAIDETVVENLVTRSAGDWEFADEEPVLIGAYDASRLLFAINPDQSPEVISAQEFDFSDLQFFIYELEEERAVSGTF